MITVRPIPSVGKGKATPARGASAGSARWHSERRMEVLNIDRHVADKQPEEQCICGGQPKRGDGKQWSDAEGDEACLACASLWRGLVRGPSDETQPSIDSVEIAHGPDSPEWAVDRQGVQIQEGELGPRVRPVFPRLREVRGAHDPTDYLSIARAMKFDCSLPETLYSIGRLSAVLDVSKEEQSGAYTCVGRQHACAVQKDTNAAARFCGRIVSSS